MEEKEFPKFARFEDEPAGPPGIGEGIKAKASNFGRKLFVFIKFVLGICFLPIVYSATVSFLSQFSRVDKTIQEHFWWGAITLLLIYLFAWEPVVFYTKGQKLLEFFFRFFKPLVKVAPYLLPVYTIILALFYCFFSWTLDKNAINYFIFFLGLSISLHLIFSAKTMRGKKDDFFKSNYIFGFSLIYIINLFLLALILNCIFDKFSIVEFCNGTYQTARGILDAVITQLFVIKK